MSMKPACLVVDDEADIRELLVLTLQRMGIHADSAENLEDARYMLARHQYGLCLTDMRMPDGNGLDLVKHVMQHYPGLPIAVITAHGSADNAVSALKAGAFDYLSKPISLQQLRPLVESALKLSQPQPASFGSLELVGDSAPMQRVRTLIEKLARSQAPVYISGESGTGKELAARLIHAGSGRHDSPFVSVSCGGIAPQLFEGELFGGRKNTTGQEKPGLLQLAAGGTLFLDEIADLPAGMQTRLLQVIQEKKLPAIGGRQEENIDVRIISASRQDLPALMAQGRFRQDLYYRLNVIELAMPALRDIVEDIPLLARKMLEKHSELLDTATPEISPQAMQRLAEHGFPGNVRELENILQRALALCDGAQIDVADLQLQVKSEPQAADIDYDGQPLPDYLEHVERKVIADALAKAGQNKTAAARLLGISFRTLRYRLAKLGMSKDSEEES